jgi:NADH-quinone oxidoreductase subunit J
LRHRGDRRHQAASEQVRVNPRDRVRVVKMAPSRPDASTAAQEPKP